MDSYMGAMIGLFLLCFGIIVVAAVADNAERDDKIRQQQIPAVTVTVTAVPQ